MDILVAAMIAWISTQTGLSMVSPPRVEFVTPPIMSEIVSGPNVAPNPQLRALYIRHSATIYLRANWDPSRLNDQSELVHELVHHFQRVHNLPYQCDAARETLAYDLQMKWLKEQGVEDPHELLQINQFYIVMVSVCRDSGDD
jgi:hypothetical protein